jgi:transposase-like protein
MRGRAHSDETRAAVIAALLEGQGVTQIAEAFALPKATVSRIKNELAPEQLEQVGTEKRERIEDLVETHLRESLNACAAIARHAANPRWLSRQNAADVAVLYGVLTDKSIRILEAAQAADGSSLETE